MVVIMKKRFKARRRFHKNIILYVILVLVIVFISFRIVSKKDKYYLVNPDYELFKFSIDRDKFLFKSGLNFDYEKKIEKVKEVFVETFVPEKKKQMIYIYNTHQTEEYDGYDVLSAAKELQEELKQYDIEAIVENTNIRDELTKNNYVYSQSYRVTRELLEKNLSDDISLYIDLHRDSSNHDVSTTVVDDKSYARMMFVVGGKHDGYLTNYHVSEELNKMIKNINPLLSRGILLRKSSSYNQDVNGNVILIELGGPNNTKEEVSNSIKALALAINYYLSE